MKKYLNNIRTLAALLMAGAAFTACSSDDNIIGEQPAQGTKTYTMTINASKGGDATTRALSLEGKTLNATWATTENVYVKKGDTWATGSLQPQADGATATLKGELSGIEINASDVLTLQFPKRGDISYAGQVGTLEDIAAKYDYATATVTVADVSATGNIIPEEATTTFTNQQAIVKFTLIDKADGTTSLSATQLVVSDGTTDYTINPTPATSEIYAAIPGFSGQTVTLTATVGEDTYIYEKTGVSFTNGQYYEITVKMTKQAAAATTLNNTIKAWTAGSYAVPAGGLTYSDAITVSGDVTLTLTDGQTLTLNKGISLASGATLTIQGNGTMAVNGTNNSTASTVAGSTGTLILTSGTLTATGGKGEDKEPQGIGASGGAAINGSVTVNGGSLTAKGGNGGNCIGVFIGDNLYGGAGGAAISGDVTITDGAVAATGGNGGSIGASDVGVDVHGGAGGAAIGGNATLTGGTLTAKQGANGTKTGVFEDSSVGAGGKAVAGTVTNNGGTVN